MLSPILTRKKSLAEEIAGLDVSAFDLPVLPRKQDDAVARVSATRVTTSLRCKRLIERDYTIPEPQTAEEVIGYYARRIAQDVKLPSQFAALAPKVREFLETKAFGGPVRLERARDDQGDQQQRGQYVTVKTFAEALRKLVITELEPAAYPRGPAALGRPRLSLGRGRRSRPPSAIFNLVPCDNGFEKEFALS